MIPENFDVQTGQYNGQFTSLLEHFNRMLPEKAFQWSKFLKRWATKVEMESTSWASEILDKNMTSELKFLVQEDLAWQISIGIDLCWRPTSSVNYDMYIMCYIGTH